MSISANASPARRRQSSKQRDIWLTVAGYKAIRDETRVRVAPLTIFSGANSSGKSSFMQPFLMMKQTLDSAFDPGALLLYGANVKVTDHSQLLSRGKSRFDVSERMVAGLEQDDQARTITFSSTSNGLHIDSDVIRSRDERIELSESLSLSRQHEFRERFADQAESYTKIFNREGSAGLDSWEFEVYRNRCFLELMLVVTTGGRALRVNISDEISDDERWVDLLRGIIHVPGLRGNPERAYSRSAVGSTYPGTFETYVASIVYEWTTSNSSKLSLLGSQLEQLGLTWKLSARKLNDASIELSVGRMPHGQQGGAHDLVSVADVGFGVSQTLPVLVSLLAAQPGQIVYVEQPEIHLHPRAQLALANALVAAANRGVKVIAETHSSLVIRGIQTAVAQRRLAPRDLSLNWFGRDALTGFQTTHTAEVDEEGRFGEWPVDFDDVSRSADWAYLDVIASREL